MRTEHRKRFPTELKESVVRRYLSTGATVRELAEEIGSSVWSVRSWVSEYRAQGTVGKSNKTRSSAQGGRSAADKLRLLLELKGLPDKERGAVLRREGVRDGDLERWEQEALQGLQGGDESAVQKRRIAQLERESAHHQKRLKEAAALLTLQKKVQALWGDEDEDTTPS